MRRSILFLILLLLTPLALAETRVLRQGNDEVRVFDGPCVSAETIGRIPENEREGWKKVQGYINGQRYFGCWRPLDEAFVYILWEDGDQGLIPLTELKPVIEV
jgi:hypothetical protein